MPPNPKPHIQGYIYLLLEKAPNKESQINTTVSPKLGLFSISLSLSSLSSLRPCPLCRLLWLLWLLPERWL